MIYDVYIRSVTPVEDHEEVMEPIVMKIASFHLHETTIGIGDVLHLTEDVMVDGIAPSAVRVNEIEHLISENRTILGVGLDTNGTIIVGSEPNEVQLQVPCLLNTREMAFTEFLG